MKCSTCGTDNPANAKFCGNCRQPLAKSTEGPGTTSLTEPEDVQAPGIRRWPITIVQWLWAAILIIGGLAELTGSGTGTEGEWGGLLIIIGGGLSVYGGLLTFGNKTLFGRITSGKGAALLAVVGFVVFVVGVSTVT